MNHITLLKAGDIAGDSGFMSHQWPVLGVKVPSPLLIIVGAVAAVLLVVAYVYALIRKMGLPGAIRAGLIVAAFILVPLVLALVSGGANIYSEKYSPYEENIRTFTSSYGIDPKDVTVDASDCSGLGYSDCRFSDIFNGRDESEIALGKPWKTWFRNQSGNGDDRPVRITLTTRKEIRRMTVRMEGDGDLYLYERTGDGQRIILPNSVES